MSAKKYGFIFSFAIIIFFLISCAVTQTGVIRDIEYMPQKAEYYIGENDYIVIAPTLQNEFYDSMVRKFFEPWERKEPLYSESGIFWGISWAESREIYGENNLPFEPARFEKIKINCDTPSYPSKHNYAVTVKNASMRVLPTARPVFFNPRRPGEGFPFDYMQNSLVPAGTPVLVTHISSDEQWLLTETSYAGGWMKQDEVAFADNNFIEKYKTKKLAGFTNDDVMIKTEGPPVLFTGRVGMKLPFYDSEKGGVYVPLRGYDGNAVIIKAFVSENIAELPLAAASQNFIKILNNLMDKPYGWGGMYENRDCSALIKDIMETFGIYMPRNSRQQAGAGKFISLEGLSAAEKEKKILETGRPLRTLLYMPGHIMLYIGKDETGGRPAVYHSIWGIGINEFFREYSGRFILGRTVITTLTPGREMLNAVRPLLAQRVTGMVFIDES